MPTLHHDFFKRVAGVCEVLCHEVFLLKTSFVLFPSSFILVVMVKATVREW